MPAGPQHAHAVFLATMDRLEKRLRHRMVVDKAAFIHAAAERYRHDRVPDFFDLADKHRARVFDSLKDQYRRVIPAFGSLGLAQIKSRRFKDDEEDDLFSRLTQEWIHTEGLKRSHQIADTTEADILQAISAGMEEGDGVDAISRRIEAVSDLSEFRSDLIARTETHQAANYAGIESVRDAENKLGVAMRKEWLPTPDARTRPDHAAMAGSEPIPLDDKFLVGGEEMDRPGDPGASADETINCRCTCGYSEAE